MSEEAKFEILQKLFTSENINSLREYIVIQDNDGYELFSEFRIRKINNYYFVTKDKTDLSEQFFTLKNAVIWTTLYKQTKIIDANRVKVLDKMLEGATFEVELNQVLVKKARTDDSKLVYLTKLTEARLKKKETNKELQVYGNTVRNWQYRKFNQLTS